MKKAHCIAALAAGLLASGGAQATVYDWTVDLPVFASSASITGSGTLTTQDTPTGVGYLITSMTGTYGAATITGLIPPGGLNRNDNLLFPVGPHFDLLGVSFSVSQDPGALEGGAVNLYFYRVGYTDTGITDYGSFTVTPVAPPPPPAPEPATWVLGFAGLMLTGAALRRRRDERSERPAI